VHWLRDTIHVLLLLLLFVFFCWWRRVPAWLQDAVVRANWHWYEREDVPLFCYAVLRGEGPDSLKWRAPEVTFCVRRRSGFCPIALRPNRPPELAVLVPGCHICRTRAAAERELMVLAMQEGGGS